MVTSKCRPLVVFCQKTGARIEIVFDWTPACTKFWRGGEEQTHGEVVALNEVIRPTTSNGYQYRYTRAGLTNGVAEPPFADGTVEVVGATYKDGSAILTAEFVTNESLYRTIIVSEWDEVTDLTIDGDDFQQSNGEQKSWAYAGGDVPGTYRVRNRVTFSDGKIDVAEASLVIE